MPDISKQKTLSVLTHFMLMKELLKATKVNNEDSYIDDRED